MPTPSTPSPRTTPTARSINYPPPAPGVPHAAARTLRCAIYTRKSSDDGLDQHVNSLHAQRESCEAYIVSQKSEGWACIPDHYDDGGYSGGSMERPGLARLLDDIRAGKVDIVVCYKIDRVTRSIRDFGRIVEVLEAHDVALVSTTQLINTATSMGRLMLHMLLSFAQFERELGSERTRDKIRTTREKGLWLGGRPILGYDGSPGGPVINAAEAAVVRSVFSMYLEQRSIRAVVAYLSARGVRNKSWAAADGRTLGGQAFSKTTVSRLLSNVLYRGLVPYKDRVFDGRHPPIIPAETFDRVQRLLAENNRSGTGITGVQQRNATGLLKGRVACGCCGKNLQYTTARGDRGVSYTYLRCVTPGCPTAPVPAAQVEDFVLSKVRASFSDGALVSRVLDLVRARAGERILDLEAQRTLLVDELNDAEPRFTHPDEGVRAEAAGRHSQASATLVTVERSLADARASLVDRATVEAGLREFSSVWACLSPTERVQLISTVVERVVYDSVKGEIAITRRPAGSTNAAASTQQESAA